LPVGRREYVKRHMIGAGVVMFANPFAYDVDVAPGHERVDQVIAPAGNEIVFSEAHPPNVRLVAGETDGGADADPCGPSCWLGSFIEYDRLMRGEEHAVAD
jgi:hypothetical protein